MAYKVFSNGDGLTGSELNTYLMNQSVMTFASTTARDAALVAPLEGMIVWLQDSNKYVYYSGTAWTDLITPPSGENVVINGAFDIAQRGTSFSNPASGSYVLDRYRVLYDGTGATRTISQQIHTPGLASFVSGEERANYFRYAQTVAGSGASFNVVEHVIEDVRTFAGQTVTLSFYARAAASRTLPGISFIQKFGSGGSADVLWAAAGSVSVGTSWTRFTYTVTLPGIATKTIGTGSHLILQIQMPINQTFTIDLDGLQVESGSTATAFKRNASNIQGELAACQRYYVRLGANSGATTSAYNFYAWGNWTSSTNMSVKLNMPVPMRTTPSSLEWSGLAGFNLSSIGYSVSAAAGINTSEASPYAVALEFTTGSASSGTIGRLSNNNNTNGYVGLSAEL